MGQRDMSALTDQKILKVNPNSAAGLFCQYKMIQKTWKMTENLAHVYSSERTQW